MRKQLIEQSAHAVATQVRAVEDSIEAALMELAELQARLIRARSTTGVALPPAMRRLRKSPAP
jgi:hypothetical protein